MTVIFSIFFENLLFSLHISLEMKYRRHPTIYPLQTKVFPYGCAFFNICQTDAIYLAHAPPPLNHSKRLFFLMEPYIFVTLFNAPTPAHPPP